ncbi:phage major capsid protein [Mycolicibacterium fortuitum]|uniref:phage major capsid protein n=1 Tax=Mycolicibacterium fortuitum TaxID=1766 RepID=UPI0007EACDA5|nr:phage major capsid protein [Mycolicibacterium fortuitum]OBB33795.1 capsid protein [Mycolicibacterium fortuitum]OBB47477.1 capsid protein [Mycolicibacterium fortuitum]OBB54950.1 capsid protein [Mycolicibacterium fortuitum]OBF85536.1 capsid protein [Mycolicibacterium fortuitum]OBG26121.1 capsid protein [Mycolicibacterium fortuitum]
MTMQHSNIADSWTPTDIGELLNKAIQAKSVAIQASTLVRTERVKIQFPLWVSDPAVNWLAELEEITATDGSTGEVVCIPSKVGGITRLSSESVDDSDPAIADQVADGLANQIANGIDVAFLGDGSGDAKVPDGLLSTAYQTVDTGASITNLDPFVAAIFKARAVGAKLTHWVMSDTTAETLSKIKKQTGSNETLLQLVADGLQVAGLPVLTHPSVDAATFAWGIDATRTKTVVRKDTEVKRFDAVSVDGVDIRAIARAGFAFLHPQANVRLYDAS